MPPTYRADQVGSFLRPDRLKEARAALTEGRISQDDLTQVEDECILEVIDLQRRAGIDVYTDGEYRRPGWSRDFADSVEGYVPGEPPVRMQWSNRSPGPPGQQGSGGSVIGARLRQKRRLTGNQVAFLKAHAPGPIKMTLPAASYIVARGFKPGVTDKVYASRADVLHDVAAIIRAEIEALIDEGVTYVQLDNPHYPDYVVAERQAQWRAIGIDPEQALREDIAADNESLSDFDRSGVVLAMHLCRGNGARGAWHTSGGYDEIAEPLFGGLAVDRFLLEYDSERAGSFEPLRHMPAGKIAVLGLVTTKAGTLEPAELIRARIEEAAKYTPAGRLALSPQCGFASVAEGNPLTWEQQRAKLQLVVDVARDVWKD